MKHWIIGLFVTAAVAAAPLASACPVGQGDDVRPIVNVSNDANVLLQQARRLETAAASRERSAATLDRRADALASRARLLRRQAFAVSTLERADLLAVADELSDRASSERAQADEERTAAATLRARARSLRERANVLVGGGNGHWRRRPPPVGDRVI